MKIRVIGYFMVLACTLPSYSQAALSVAGTYGTDLDQWGVQVQGAYRFQHWGVRASYARFFQDQVYLKPDLFNVDLSWEVPTEQILQPYVYTGINLLRREIREAEDLISYSTYGGLNLGLGGYLQLSPILPYVEFKYVTGTTGQWFITGGLMYVMPW